MRGEMTKKRIKRTKERLFAIGLSIIYVVSLLLWLLQPFKDETLLLMMFGGGIGLYWLLDGLERKLLSIVTERERKRSRHERC